MKKFLLSFLLSFMTMSSVFAKENIIIEIKVNHDSIQQQNPRMLARKLITADYDNSMISFSIAETLLPSVITVTNETTGETFTEVANQTNMCLIISGTIGFYNVEIITTNGVIYSGYFQIE